MLLKEAAFNQEQYIRVIDKAEKDLKDASRGNKDDTLQALQDIESATKKFGDAFLESMINVTKGVSGGWKDMANAMVDDINRIILRLTVVDPLVKALTGAMGVDEKGREKGGKGSGGSDLFSKALGFFGFGGGGSTPDFSAASSFNSGGYITDFPTFGISAGVRSVPYDQMALLHKGERVLNEQEAAKMDQPQTSPAANINVTNHFSITTPDGSLSRSTQAHLAARVGTQINRVMARDR